MRKNLIHLGMAAGLLATTAFTFQKTQSIEVGEVAPMVEEKMTNIDDSKQSIKDLSGEKGIVVVFSCNTCPFVVGSDSFGGWERMYNELAATAKAKGFGFVLINSNEAKRENDDSLEEMKKHAEEKNYQMAYLLDTDSKLANAFGAKTTPHVFLIDKDLKIAYTGSIDNSWDNARLTDIPYLQNALNQLSNGEKITENKTAPRGCSIKRKG